MWCTIEVQVKNIIKKKKFNESAQCQLYSVHLYEFQQVVNVYLFELRLQHSLYFVESLCQ